MSGHPTLWYTNAVHNPPSEGFSSATLRAAAATARQALDARATFVSVPGPDGLTITVRDGLREPAWNRMLIKRGRGLGGRVVIEDAPISLADYLEDGSITGEHRPTVRAEGLRAIACVPIRSDAGLEALLYLADGDTVPFGDRAIGLAQRIADLAGAAVALERERAMLAGRARHALRTDDRDALRAVADRLANGQPRVDHDLSDREVAVLDLLAAGASNADIADQLVIVEATAKEHVRNLRRKLGASSRLEAVAQARRAGLL